MHESVESVFVVVAPFLEKRTGFEEDGGKTLERVGRKCRVFFSDEVFVVPMSTEAMRSGKRRLRQRNEAYACSTWKHTRSMDCSSSSGRLRIKRLPEKSQKDATVRKTEARTSRDHQGRPPLLNP